MSLVSDIINEAFLDLGVITVNEAISTAMQTDAFMRLNQLLDSLNAEGPHAADAFRTAAVMIREPERKKEQEKRRPGSKLSPRS